MAFGQLTGTDEDGVYCHVVHTHEPRGYHKRRNHQELQQEEEREEGGEGRRRVDQNTVLSDACQLTMTGTR